LRVASTGEIATDGPGGRKFAATEGSSAQRGDTDGNGALTATLPRLSQETLAEMIGTPRMRVNFFMNKFRRLGMIEYFGKTDGKFVVHRSLSAIFSGD